ncbi:phosphoglycerate kinase [Parasaccharibacter sp. TMW2.1882]|uniref:Phosphoglycerate kinase n=2 Tax=Parasaccharibacter apium TaxID=1510841 RepID=A0ABX4ZL56_9PROT|nr:MULTISPECIES: phosphoglycerate kinase [Acetobacteraceae]MCL1562330.1 phosphoglycerate kinase [Parasaccharibacter sp. TMW 2.1886]MCQ0040955.1 phosphoglycerate kinase [Bombella sp.]MUG79976.1 phosphoglycerate kinase [Bombella sp. ESL0380]MUH03328.1 phosphoglycerate kinase [Bombella sp. ESL0387]QGT75567.1 phosphoglycerate kinase [Bombella sp. ESL0368]
MAFRTLDKAEVRGKRVLLRADLNVPMHEGAITDTTRIERVLPTIRELTEKGAKVILLSHFDRPKGKVVPEMSLAPVGKRLGELLGRPVAFAADCVGPKAKEAVDALKDGGVLLLENTRFHAEEEKNDPEFSKALAANGDIYVDDAFSAAHRAHASTEGVAHLLPAYAGRLMEAELKALSAALESPKRPVGAVIGGSKISTKLDLIGNVLDKVDVLFIGGAMANTFLAAEGVKVGKSLQESDMHETARKIAARAKEKGCKLVLPVDAVVAREFKAGAASEVVPVDKVPEDTMILDAGPKTAELISKHLADLKTLVWNGPLGAFEIEPFDKATVEVARAAAKLTEEGKLLTVAGGGDTVSALRHAGVADRMSYVSTAGGAFLEWLEGKTLPGVEVLRAK